MLFILLLNQLVHGAPRQNQDPSLSIALGDESNARLDDSTAIMDIQDVGSHARNSNHSHLEEKPENDVPELLPADHSTSYQGVPTLIEAPILITNASELPPRLLDLFKTWAKEEEGRLEEHTVTKPAQEGAEDHILTRKQRNDQRSLYVTVTPRRQALVLPDPRDDSPVMKGYPEPFQTLFNIAGYKTTRMFDQIGRKFVNKCSGITGVTYPLHDMRD